MAGWGGWGAKGGREDDRTRGEGREEKGEEGEDNVGGLSRRLFCYRSMRIKHHWLAMLGKLATSSLLSKYLVAETRPSGVNVI